MDKLILKAQKRETLGKKVKNLRAEGVLPANIYGKGIDSVSIKVDGADFENVFKEAGETGLVEIEVGKEKRPTLIDEVQTDPVTDEILHIDFRQVDLKEKVIATVPIEQTGESPAEKKGIGTAVLYLDEVEVEALPTDFPEKFEVDVSGLEEVDEAIYIKDLPLDKDKIEIKADPEEIVVKVEPPREEEEEVVETVSPEDVIITEEAEGEETPEGEQKQEKEAPKEEKTENEEPEAQ
jgi:large subunit ribosomal protein L25